MQTDKVLVNRERRGSSGLHLIVDRLRRTRSFASLCLAFVLVAPQAFAQPWQRLPDGRVVIEVKRHKLAFDPNIWRAGTGYPPAVEFHAAGEKERYSLTRAIEDPDGARAFFSRFDEITLTMTNGWNEPSLFLNRFDRRSLPHSSRIELVIFDKDAAHQLCDPLSFFGSFTLRTVHCSESELGPFETDPPDIDGFLRVVSPTPSARETFVKYVLAPEIRKSYATAPILIGCLPSLNSSELREWGQCAATSTYRAGAGIFYQFRFSSFPKSSWIKLDRRMREIYADILMQNEGGQQ
jgi:hypothetical protein